MSVAMGPGAFFAGYEGGGGVTATLEISTPRLAFNLVDTTEEFLFVGDTQACVPGCGETQRQTQSVDAGAAQLELKQLLGNFTLVLGPRGPANATLSAASIQRVVDRPVFSSGDAPFESSFEPWPENTVSWPNKYLVRAETPTHHLQSTSIQMDYEGPFFFLVSDGVLSIRNSTGDHEVRTGKWREALQEDPAGAGAQHVRYHHVALVGELDGRLRVEYAGPHGHLAPREMTLHHISKLSVPLADAKVDIRDFHYESSKNPYLDIEGRFNASFASVEDASGTEPSRIRVQVAGQIVQVTENRLLARAFPLKVAAATAAGLGFLVIAYAVFSWIRRGAVYVGVRALEWKLFTWVPFAAKLDLAKVLEHPVRQGIMQMLSGAHAMKNLADLRREVATAFGISTMAAYFHLRTLWRANHLTVVRLGSQHYIGPNSGGMGPKEQRVAASLLHHPAALAAAQYICAHPGASQGDVVAHVQKACTQDGKAPSRGVVLRWIGRLETTTIIPTHLVKAFGRSLNRDVDPKDAAPVPVSLVARRQDPDDARVVRYEPSDVLYDVVKTFLERRPELGTALTELTRLKVLRREQPPAAKIAASPDSP